MPGLQPSAKSAATGLRSKPAALASLALGLTGVIAATAVQLGRDQLFSVHPDVRLTLPFFVAALIATVASLVRKERAFAMSIGGLALATSALALGWILALAIVAAVAGLVIYVLSEVL